MKKLFLSLTLLLSIPAAHAMGPAAYESGAAACEPDTAESSAAAAYEPRSSAESSAVAVEMIPIQQAIDRINTKLTNPQVTELTRRLQLCADENNLIAPTTAHEILRQLLHESSTAILSLDGDDDEKKDSEECENYQTAIKSKEEKYENYIQQLTQEEYNEHIKELNNIFVINNNLKEARKKLVQGLSHTIINELFIAQGIRLYTLQSNMTKLLLQHGANPNTVDESGCNLLQMCMTQYLLFSSGRSFSRTCLVVFLNKTAIPLLIKAGLRVDHKNNNGHTLLDLAVNYGTYEALTQEENNNTPFRTTAYYHEIRSLILQTLCEVQAIRQYADKALRDAQLPTVLTNLIYEYATLPDRDKEINFVNQHWQNIKWKSRRDNTRFYTQSITRSLRKIAANPTYHGRILFDATADVATNPIHYGRVIASDPTATRILDATIILVLYLFIQQLRQSIT